MFNFDLSEMFRQLARPPVVEAVIHWQARALCSLEQDSLVQSLAEELPGFTTPEPIHQLTVAAMFPETESGDEVQRSRAWHGLRLKSVDGNFLIQFTRDGLVFSQVNDYQNWDSFSAAALMAWNVFVGIATPTEIQRLGVRFINHFPSATPENLREILIEPPVCPMGLPLSQFTYQSEFAVPGHPLAVRVIKLMQPSITAFAGSAGLFLDIDVFSTKELANDSVAVQTALSQMRWLKNKIFFTLLNESALKTLTGVAK
ncbi:MAG: TIGR04255 family protein [Planctomycetes bacterium]|nr:TIGR04255 family protein [Planctomycetota bacterium]